MSNCTEDFRRVGAFIIILTGFTGFSGFVIIFLLSLKVREKTRSAFSRKKLYPENHVNPVKKYIEKSLDIV